MIVVNPSNTVEMVKLEGGDFIEQHWATYWNKNRLEYGNYICLLLLWSIYEL